MSCATGGVWQAGSHPVAPIPQPATVVHRHAVPLGDGAGTHRTATIDRMSFMRATALLLLATALIGCAAPAGAGAPSDPANSPADSPGPAIEPTPSAAPSPRPAPSRAPGRARLEPASGAYFGVNPDWGRATATDVVASLGVTPAVWVQFAIFPLDAGARANLDGFVEQVATVGGIALITLEPHGGLASVTDAAAEDLADALAGYWERDGVATYVRFAHEMNGSWYPWSQQPAAYVAAFGRVARAVHARAPASAMIWAPNQGNGYPFRGGPFEAAPGSPEVAELDTDGDGALSAADDPYVPYYPGDDAVDWVGMSLYHWGVAYPWGENELPLAGTFEALVRGRDLGAHAGALPVPDFYATYSEGHDKPMAIIETGILYDPAAKAGPPETALKSAWFEEVLGDQTRTTFPRIEMINWFEWRKRESEVDRVIDWRLGSKPELARELLAGVTPGWLTFGEDLRP